MRSLLCVALLALVCASVCALPALASDEFASPTEESSALELAPFSAHDYFAGEWSVYRHILTRDGLSYASSLPVVNWRLEKENSTSNLVGHSVLNGTEGGYDAAEAQSLRFELHDPATGRLQVGPSDDSLRTLAQLAFTLPKGGVPMSAGVWAGAEVAGDDAAQYLLQIASVERFTLTVTPSKGRSLAAVAKADPAVAAAAAAARAAGGDDDDELSLTGPASTGHPLLSEEELAQATAFVYVGHRIRHEEPKTLFQKYGTMLLLGGMLIVNVWMRSRTSAKELTTAQKLAAARAAAGVQPRTVRPAPTPAQIEEIDTTMPVLDRKSK